MYQQSFHVNTALQPDPENRANNSKKPVNYATKAKNGRGREWESNKDEIRRLYIDQGWTLKQTMAEVGGKFKSKNSERTWKTKLEGWGFDKNITQGMEFMLSKAEKREREEGKATEFTRDGVPVPQETIQRFKKPRAGNQTTLPHSSEIGTPTNITYHTPRFDNYIESEARPFSPPLSPPASIHTVESESFDLAFQQAGALNQALAGSSSASSVEWAVTSDVLVHLAPQSDETRLEDLNILYASSTLEEPTIYVMPSGTECSFTYVPGHKQSLLNSTLPIHNLAGAEALVAHNPMTPRSDSASQTTATGKSFGDGSCINRITITDGEPKTTVKVADSALEFGRHSKSLFLARRQTADSRLLDSTETYLKIILNILQDAQSDRCNTVPVPLKALGECIDAVLNYIDSSDFSEETLWALWQKHILAVITTRSLDGKPYDFSAIEPQLAAVFGVLLGNNPEPDLILKKESFFRTMIESFPRRRPAIARWGAHLVFGQTLMSKGLRWDGTEHLMLSFSEWLAARKTCPEYGDVSYMLSVVAKNLNPEFKDSIESICPEIWTVFDGLSQDSKGGPGVRLLAICLAFYCFNEKANWWECGERLMREVNDEAVDFVSKYNYYPQYWIILYLKLFEIFQGAQSWSNANSALESASAITGLIAPFKAKLCETKRNDFIVTLEDAMKASFPRSRTGLEGKTGLLEKIKVSLFGAVSEYDDLGSVVCTSVAVEEYANIEELNGIGREQDRGDVSLSSILENNDGTYLEELDDNNSVTFGVTYPSCISGDSSNSIVSQNLSAWFE
ncbi:uncharacterized protein PAC_19305 [Phialocephala subalpina]|uniref:Clr5 domain-containing protein n=1 Tax=Phialocephala subalpina TaxID=576137 RepID=A0A1L7XWQ6_9HELO|nr:uncharacterized protein PAC_19305 [Phialocephala subalpina]